MGTCCCLQWMTVIRKTVVFHSKCPSVCTYVLPRFEYMHLKMCESMPTCGNFHTVCTYFSFQLDLYTVLYTVYVVLYVWLCVCTSPLSCQCNLRLSNRISAAWWRFMPTLGLLIHCSLTDSHPWQTASFYCREGEREGGKRQTEQDGESEQQTERCMKQGDWNQIEMSVICSSLGEEEKIDISTKLNTVFDMPSLIMAWTYTAITLKSHWQ